LQKEDQEGAGKVGSQVVGVEEAVISVATLEEEVKVEEEMVEVLVDVQEVEILDSEGVT
jgi:hypothetical protein